MKYSANKDLHKIVHKLVKRGWSFYWGSKHGRLKHPKGTPTITVPSTPSDKRSLANFDSYIRRFNS